MSNTVKFFSKKENKVVEATIIQKNKRTVVCEIEGKAIKKRYSQLEKNDGN